MVSGRDAPVQIRPGRLAAIYAGGVVGALARVGLAEAFPHGAAVLALGDLRRQHGRRPAARWFVAPLRGHPAESHGFALLTTGICGTLTTFATLQLELFEMVDAGSSASPPPTSAATVAGGLLSSVSASPSAGAALSAMRGKARRAGSDERRSLGRGRPARRRRWRWRASRSTPSSPTIPRSPFRLGILAVNLLGTLVVGVAAGAALSGEALVIVAGGGTGSFTTFSTWMLDTERLAEAGRARPGAGSTSASRCSPASPRSPSATGSAGRSEQGTRLRRPPLPLP